LILPATLLMTVSFSLVITEPMENPPDDWLLGDICKLINFTYAGSDFERDMRIAASSVHAFMMTTSGFAALRCVNDYTQSLLLNVNTPPELYWKMQLARNAGAWRDRSAQWAYTKKLRPAVKKLGGQRSRCASRILSGKVFGTGKLGKLLATLNMWLWGRQNEQAFFSAVYRLGIGLCCGVFYLYGLCRALMVVVPCLVYSHELEHRSWERYEAPWKWLADHEEGAVEEARAATKATKAQLQPQLAEMLEHAGLLADVGPALAEQGITSLELLRHAQEDFAVDGSSIDWQRRTRDLADHLGLDGEATDQFVRFVERHARDVLPANAQLATDRPTAEALIAALQPYYSLELPTAMELVASGVINVATMADSSARDLAKRGVRLAHCRPLRDAAKQAVHDAANQAVDAEQAAAAPAAPAPAGVVYDVEVTAVAAPAESRTATASGAALPVSSTQPHIGRRSTEGRQGSETHLIYPGGSIGDAAAVQPPPVGSWWHDDASSWA